MEADKEDPAYRLSIKRNMVREPTAKLKRMWTAKSVQNTALAVRLLSPTDIRLVDFVREAFGGAKILLPVSQTVFATLVEHQEQPAAGIRVASCAP